MNFVYASMGFLIGIMLFIFMRKENKAFYFFSFVFIFMGFWWFLDAVTVFDFFKGYLRLVFRIVMAVSLLIAIVTYCKEKRNTTDKSQS